MSRAGMQRILLDRCSSEIYYLMKHVNLVLSKQFAQSHDCMNDSKLSCCHATSYSHPRNADLPARNAIQPIQNPYHPCCSTPAQFPNLPAMTTGATKLHK